MESAHHDFISADPSLSTARVEYLTSLLTSYFRGQGDIELLCRLLEDVKVSPKLLNNVPTLLGLGLPPEHQLFILIAFLAALDKAPPSPSVQDHATSYFWEYLLSAQTAPLVNKACQVLSRLLMLRPASFARLPELCTLARSAEQPCKRILKLVATLAVESYSKKGAATSEFSKHVPAVMQLAYDVLDVETKPGLELAIQKLGFQTLSAVVPFLPEQQLGSLQPFFSLFTRFFSENKMRARTLMLCSSILWRTNHPNALQYLAEKVGQLLQEIGKAVPLALDLRQEREKVALLDRKQLVSFDFFFRGLGHFFGVIIQKHSEWGDSKRALQPVLAVSLQYLMMISQLEQKQTEKGALVTWHKFVLKQDPTLRDYDALNLRLLRVLIRKTPQPPSPLPRLDDFGKEQQVPAEDMFEEARDVLLVLCQRYFSSLSQLLGEGMARLTEEPFDRRLLEGMTNTVCTLSSILTQGEQRELFLNFSKALLNLNEVRKEKAEICQCILRLLPHYQHYVASNQLLMENVPLVLLRLFPLSLNTLRQLQQFIVLPHTTHWLHYARAIPESHVRIGYWKVFWSIVAKQASRGFVLEESEFGLLADNWEAEAGKVGVFPESQVRKGLLASGDRQTLARVGIQL